METKHTPGPWIVDGGYIVGASDPSNAETIAEFTDAIPSKANARLIAASVDLLEALCYLVGADNDIQAHRGNKHDQAMNRIAALDMAARAIAKAKGE